MEQNKNLNLTIFEGEEDKVKRATTLDITKEEEADMLLNAMQDVDYKLNDCIDKELEIVADLIQEFETETISEDTGEQIIRKKHTVILFDKEGKTYVTGSGACYLSYLNIVSIKGRPSFDHPLKLIPIKAEAKEKGHFYLRLKLSKK